jgi:FtsH-binding integral membrane protein
MSDNEPTEHSSFRDGMYFLVGLTLSITLLLACLLVPLTIAQVYSPWLGLLATVCALCVWMQLGPRSMPGLLPGTICVGGVLNLVVLLPRHECCSQRS